MSLESIRNETELELFTAIHDLPTATLECEASQDVFGQSVFGETSNVSDCPATEHNARAGDPCAVHAVTLDLVKLAIHIQTLVQWVVGRYVVEPLEKEKC